MTETKPAIVLASASPRRRDLLASVGLRFQVVPSRVDETHQPGETPHAFVQRLSEEKAAEVAARTDVTGRWFIGSDTIVLCDDEILGKPVDAADSACMLRRLSGRNHQVLSGYAIFDRETGARLTRCIATEVSFRTLTEQEIEGYIATGEPADKAGSYAIQGIGAFMVSAICGSYTNVVGLPLCKIVEDLQQLGAFRLFATPTEPKTC
ncbi:MAG: septum formation inhibitor Maf [Desulfuromonadaceae bacterium]|nr:septum formation inhibitor Maf [Desulfuromonadaceae bacterium]